MSLIKCKCGQSSMNFKNLTEKDLPDGWEGECCKLAEKQKAEEEKKRLATEKKKKETEKSKKKATVKKEPAKEE